jgi:hypothetical protein
MDSKPAGELDGEADMSRVFAEVVGRIERGNAALAANNLEGAMVLYSAALRSTRACLRPTASEKVPAEAPEACEVMMTLMLKMARVEAEAAARAEVSGDSSKADELYYSATRRTQRVKDLDPQSVEVRRRMAQMEEALRELGETLQIPTEQRASGG